MEDTEIIIGVLAILVPVAMGVIMFYKTTEQKRQDDSKQTMWKRIDELKDDHDEFKDEVLKNYLTSQQLHEFLELSMKPRDIKLEHIDKNIEALNDKFDKFFGGGKG